MENLRRIQRTYVSRPAKIMAIGSTEMVDCMVRDLTDLGAGLQISDSDDIPDRFELVFDSARFRRMCEVRWRGPDRMGVAFVRPVDHGRELAYAS